LKKKKGFKINSSSKSILFISIGILFITGLAWLIIHNFFYSETDFGITPSPIEPALLKIHGLAAPVFLMVFGALFPTHISRAFKARINMKTGLFLLAILFLLITTGYSLYYIGSENLLKTSSLTHSILGVICVPLLIGHIITGKAFINYRKK